MNFVLRTAHAEEKKKGGHTNPNVRTIIYVTVSGKTTLLAEIEKVGFLLCMDSINTRLCFSTSC